MIEQKELPAPAQGAEGYWRAKARAQGWKEERLAMYCFDWVHGPEPLHCDAIPPNRSVDAKLPAEIQQQCPNEGEMQVLRGQGVTGRLRQDGGSVRLDPGPISRAILLIDHAVPSEEDLREADAASVIYIQTPENKWRMLPPAAPLLDRFLILTPGAGGNGRMSILGQAVDGSGSGGACSDFTN